MIATFIRGLLVMSAIAGFAALNMNLLATGVQFTKEGDIHKVDFLNFTYRPGCLANESDGKDGSVRVVNGEDITRGEQPRSAEYFYFKVFGPFYGDLNGDGSDEAVLFSVCNTGGTGYFTTGYVYTMRNGKPYLLTTIDGGDRADGGISGMKIENGILKIDVYGTYSGGACCPEYVETLSFKLVGKRLVRAGKSTRRKYNEKEDPLYTHRVKFEPGKIDGRHQRCDFNRRRISAAREGGTDNDCWNKLS